MAALLLSLAVAMTGAELLAEAGRAFAEGLAQRQRGERGAEAFRRAAARFEELRERGVENAQLLGNLGNAYYLAGDLPRAILAYRQALRLSPEDRGLRERLAFAREQVELADGRVGRPPDDPWPPIDRRVALAAAALLYAAGWAALTRGWARGLRGWMLAGLVAITAAAGAAYYVRPRPDPPLVVVARDGVPLRKGNGESFPPWFDAPLNRGVEASLLYRRGDWLQIELAGGEVGWVHVRDAVTD
jgi:tetratricopeptide (TPR) repeat protein